jgi:Tol biopolymer transport system component
MFSPDGTRLVYSRGRAIRNIFRVPIVEGAVTTWDDAEQITFDEALNENFDLSPDGQTLLVGSDRSGNPDLWLVPVDGGEPRSLTNDPTPDWFPQWSPDGTSMAFYSYRSGNREIWVRSVERGVARQLTQGDAESVMPSWSPDGREIAFYSPRAGTDDIYAVSVEGGEPRKVTSGEDRSYYPVYSTDGNWIFMDSRTDDGPRFLARVPVEGGEPEQITDDHGDDAFPRPSRDGRHVYFLSARDRIRNIWVLSLDDGEERAVTDLRGRSGRLPIDALAVGEQYLYFGWAEETGDLWLMDVVEGDE